MGCLEAFENGVPMLRGGSAPFLNALEDKPQVWFSVASLVRMKRFHRGKTLFLFESGGIRKHKKGSIFEPLKKAPRNWTQQHMYIYLSIYLSVYMYICVCVCARECVRVCAVCECVSHNDTSRTWHMHCICPTGRCTTHVAGCCSRLGGCVVQT